MHLTASTTPQVKAACCQQPSKFSLGYHFRILVKEALGAMGQVPPIISARTNAPPLSFTACIACPNWQLSSLGSPGSTCCSTRPRQF
eukprot:1140858-Pelagomonas_calceolata.AAC.2